MTGVNSKFENIGTNREYPWRGVMTHGCKRRTDMSGKTRGSRTTGSKRVKRSLTKGKDKEGERNLSCRETLPGVNGPKERTAEMDEARSKMARIGRGGA